MRFKSGAGLLIQSVVSHHSSLWFLPWIKNVQSLPALFWHALHISSHFLSLLSFKSMLGNNKREDKELI